MTYIPDEVYSLAKHLSQTGHYAAARALMAIRWESPLESMLREMGERVHEYCIAWGELFLPILDKAVDSMTKLGDALRL